MIGSPPRSACMRIQKPCAGLGPQQIVAAKLAGTGKAPPRARSKGKYKMFNRFNSKRSLLLGTALVGAGIFTPTAALADCLPDASGQFILCQNAAPNGYQTTTNGVTITVDTAATVGTGAATPSPLLSAGTTSVVNNNN